MQLVRTWANKNSFNFLSVPMSDLPKIVYFGSDAICLPGLRYLFEQGRELCTLAGVITQPDRRQGRGKKLQQNPVAEYASSQGIPLLQPEKPDAALADWLRTEEVTLAFVMAYGHFLPKAVREAPAHGMLNFHGSLLPAYRGASPVETAIALGEAETGVCLMQVVKEMDAGAVADRERVCIEDTDTSPVVRAKVGEAVVPLLQRDLAASLVGELEFSPQEVSQATFCRKISKEDGALDFGQSACAIDARLRAFTPWPGGYFDHGETRIKVGRCSATDSPTSALPGTVLVVGETVDVATSDGVLCLHELQRPGGRMLPVPDFLRGYPIQVGEQLPSVVSVPLLV
jgi:methionyl-tRNA formyltransferase